ncbi:hypothetical protein Goari_010510 [Gossypium aridum]|uniref:DUF4283 domain-containing protein n=1 Tax=Gossypium aridum TaxID=34290 RepID=A0A7J8Y0L6_GOSAI|nr:hypothetical protein [Gossypium aridum]
MTVGARSLKTIHHMSRNNALLKLTFASMLVQFRGKDDDTSNDMMIDLSSEQPTSWRDKLVDQSSKDAFNGSEGKEDLDIWDGDIQKSIVNAPLHMMDIENGYFLVKFQNKLDCEKAFSKGPWTIFGQYLTVQPWTFLGLPGYLNNHKIITEIGEMVGKVVKLHMNTNNKARGRFARMAVYVDLEKPLVS